MKPWKKLHLKSTIKCFKEVLQEVKIDKWPDLSDFISPHRLLCYAVVTPLRKAASYEPRIAILGIWGDTWLTRGKYGIYVVVTGSTRHLLPRKISPIYCRVSYVAGNEDTLVSVA